MGRGHSGVRCVSSDGGIGLIRQEYAAAHVGNIRRDGGTDGHRSSRGVDSLSDLRLVGLSALVPAGAGVVDTLVLIAASFVANILAGFVALGMIMKKNKA